MSDITFACVPHDWHSPKWEEGGRVHNWHNYASENLRTIWPTLTEIQKQVIAELLDEMAGREHWD